MAASEFRGQACGIYPRVSSEKQAEDDKTSLKVQEDNCRAYARDEGMVPDEECVRHEAHTATESDRPELNRLLAEMTARHVPNLVVDRADRLTREGQLAAAMFLQRFLDAGITLHVASMRLVVRNMWDIMAFLNMALAAQIDNEQRAKLVQQNKRAKVRDKGRRLRGNRPPYGFRYRTTETDDQGRPINWTLEHHPDTFPTRVRILTLYQQGMSFRAIAALLTEEHVPTSRMLAGHKNAPTVWHPGTVRDIVLDPLNQGIDISYRYRYEKMPRDAKHPKTRYRRIPAPADYQIPLPDGKVDPVITEREAAAIAARHAARGVWTRTGTNAHQALLHGAIARHTCGGGMAVRSHPQPNGTVYLRYSCRLHGVQPARCPEGLTVRISELDYMVWDKVRDVLLTPGALHDLAEQQARLDFGGDTAGELARLRRVADGLKERCAHLVDAIATTANKFARDALNEKLAQLEPEVAKAAEQIRQYEAVLQDHEARRQFIADLELEVLRYQARIRRLDIANPGDIQSMHSILLSLGTKVTVARRETGSLAVEVDLNLRRGMGAAWFLASTPEDIQADIDAAWPGATPEQVRVWAQLFEKMPRREEWEAFRHSHPDVIAAYLDLAMREMERLPSPNGAMPTTTTGSRRPAGRPLPR